MGVPSITIVNDIEWLGGQFTAESLAAIDENRGRSGTNDTPFPRSGLFKELLDRIEAFNKKTYGEARPGNTVVRTTSRPADTERQFRQDAASRMWIGDRSKSSTAFIRQERSWQKMESD